MRTSTGKYTLVISTENLLQYLFNKGIRTLNNVIVDKQDIFSPHRIKCL